MTLGATLAQVRQDAGLTIEEVSARTRVRATLWRAMENDDFSVCGGDFYARANIREFARVVGVPAADLLAIYEAEHGDEAPPTAPLFEPDKVPHPDGRRFNWSAAMAGALVLVVALGIGNVVLRDKGGDTTTATTTVESGLGAIGPSPAPGGPSSPSSPQPSPAATQVAPSTPPPPDSSLVAQAARDSVTVVLAAVNGKSWVSATNAAGKQLFQGVLAPGESRTFVDKTKVRLRLGNAGGVELTVNGQKLGSPGANGQVTSVEFTPQDPAAG